MYFIIKHFIIYHIDSIDSMCIFPKTGMENCDKNGPSMAMVTRMLPSSDKGRFYALARVFSGKLGTGQQVNIMGTKYKHGKKEDFYKKPIQRTIIATGGYTEPIDDVPCGAICVLVGIDQFLVTRGSVCTADIEQPYPFHLKQDGGLPVVRVAVEPKDPQHLPKLVEGLKRLAKSTPGVQVWIRNFSWNLVFFFKRQFFI